MEQRNLPAPGESRCSAQSSAPGTARCGKTEGHDGHHQIGGLMWWDDAQAAAARGEPAPATRAGELCCGFAGSNRCCENYPPSEDEGCEKAQEEAERTAREACHGSEWNDYYGCTHPAHDLRAGRRSLLMRVRLYESLLHRIQLHRNVTMDGEKLNRLLDKVSGWSRAHRTGNGELSEQEERENINRWLEKFDEPE
jgi:hypothetical protein